ncbi:MAG: PVC-type heme-binding CxxCH protein, partial [Planctomycetaceae bacterium]
NLKFDGPPTEINGGVWRYHPIKDQFEVVAHGFSNPWGLDFDAHGQQFITACVIPHLWHVIPGGIYHRQGGRHFNPYVYSDIRTIADHRHRSAHGGARVYQSDAFPAEYHGRIFMANIHEHAVLSDILVPKGSGFIGQHGDDFALANNTQWIGFSVEVGPSGDVYVLDWHDADICGKDVLNKETGRIFRFSPRKSGARDFEHRHADLTELSDSELARMQLVNSDWHARRARTILQHRASRGKIPDGTVAALKALLNARASDIIRLRALWTLHVTGLLTPAELTHALSDHQFWIRAWAIQLLCEEYATSDAALRKFVEMASTDPSPVVRLYLASAMQRVSREDKWRIVEALAAHDEDADDHNIPKMIWFGIEPEVARDPQRSLRLAQRSRIPLIVRHIARRLVDADQLGMVVTAAGIEGAAQRNLLLGIRDGLEGRYDVSAPADWSDTYAAIRSAGGQNAGIALQLAQQFGDTVAARTLLATLQDGTVVLHDRLDALQGLTGRKRPELIPVLKTLLSDDLLRRHAIRAMAAFDDSALADELLQRYESWNAEDRLEAVHTLASRSASGRKLTQAIKDGAVPRRDIPAWVARVLRRVVGNGFVEVWGSFDGPGADKEAQFEKYRALLTPDNLMAADAVHGRQLFNRSCAACHKLHGHGANIGPDITGANRSNIEYLLGNILTPSAVIQDAYRMHIVVTNDGRVWSGVPAAENDRQLKLRVANREQPVTIDQSQIESRDIAPVSMMPEGLLVTMTDQEVLDLMKYLQSQRQVE